jgi:hypothetical protein
MANFATKLEKGIVFSWNNEPFQKGYEDTKETADAIVKWLRKQGVKGTAIWAGTKNAPTAPIWEHYGGPSRSSTKTDFSIGKHRISLKVGKSHLMTGSVNESTATFRAAVSQSKEINEDLVDEIYTLLGQFVSGVSNDTVGRSKRTDPVLIEGEKVHKKMTTALTNMLNNSNDLAMAFVREAVTGKIKFGNSEATATHLLSIGDTYRLYDLSDDAFIQKLTNSAKVEVSFKSSYLKGKNWGKHRFWSIVDLVVKKIQEEYSYQRHDMLSETVATDVWNKVKSFFNALLEEIRDYISQGIENLIEFLELEIDVKFEDVEI